MSRRTTLGELQLAIMRVLWREGEGSVAEVHAALLAERGLAPTTIATMLVKMERKGVVGHRVEGRKFVYSPTVTEAEVTASMVGQLTERLFDGNVGALVGHLLAEHEIDAAELPRLRRLLAEPQGEGRRHPERASTGASRPTS